MKNKPDGWGQWNVSYGNAYRLLHHRQEPRQATGLVQLPLADLLHPTMTAVITAFMHIIIIIKQASKLSSSTYVLSSLLTSLKAYCHERKQRATNVAECMPYDTHNTAVCINAMLSEWWMGCSMLYQFSLNLCQIRNTGIPYISSK